MKLVNRFVLLLLGSPLHRLVGRSLVGIEYRGRRTGMSVRFVAQFARRGSAVVVLAGRPDTKTWWHNFATPWSATLLVDGTRIPMQGQVVDHPDVQHPDASAYLARYPRVGELAVLVVFEPVSEPAAPSPAG